MLNDPTPDDHDALEANSRQGLTVVGIDGSETAQNALHWALRITDERAPIVAVSTWRPPTGAFIPIVGGPVVPPRLLENNAQQRLDAALSRAESEAGVAPGRIGHTLVMGGPRDVLVGLSDDADLLVVGRTGAGRLERLLIGSTARSVARHSRCPVAVVPGDFTGGCDAVSVAFDGSPNARAALRWALSLPSTDVKVVYSHDESILDDLALDSEPRAALAEAAEARLSEMVDEVLADTGVHPNEVKLEVRHGDPRTTIVEFGSANDVLVLGAHGLGPLRGSMIGSLAEHAITHAPGVVIVHHSPDR